ncbi:MAG: helix-turn-helix domain-containing protein [Alicyclobacillus sp.]|nr:helix-turn-helix domain-containing protein [Alicyclobacillus sp.]
MNLSFGPKVRRYRLERRWSQQELSLRSGISTPHISSIERCKRFPSLEYAIRLSNALGVPLAALCDERMDFNPSNMKDSPEELPLYLQNFILNESSQPYLQAAHRLSTLPTAYRKLLTLVIELLGQRGPLVQELDAEA